MESSVLTLVQFLNSLDRKQTVVLVPRVPRHVPVRGVIANPIVGSDARRIEGSVAKPSNIVRVPGITPAVRVERSVGRKVERHFQLTKVVDPTLVATGDAVYAHADRERTKVAFS